MKYFKLPDLGEGLQEAEIVALKPHHEHWAGGLKRIAARLTLRGFSGRGLGRDRLYG